MTLIDTLIAIIVVAGIVWGYRKGLIGQLASIVSYALGIAACVTMGDKAAEVLLAVNPEAAQWPMSGVTVHAVATLVLFLLVALTVRVIAFFVKSITKAVHLGFFDRLGGSALCVFKWLFVLSIVLNLLLVLNPSNEMFSTRHAINNKPFEATLNLMPAVLGNDTLPADSLPLYQQITDTVK